MKSGSMAGKFVMIAGLVTSLALASSRGDGFELRGTLLFSSGYNDTLEMVYDDVSGGYGWVGAGLGYRVPIAEGFSILPGADFLVNFVTGGVDDGMNTIILPSVSARYQFGAESGFFIQAGVNYGIVNMGTDELEDIESDGIGFQVLAGYQTASSFFLEGGLIQIPVAVEDADWDEDFGGFAFRAGFAF